MKYILLAVLCLFIIVIGSIASIYYVNNEAEALHKQLNEIEQNIEDENWEKAYALFNSFNEKWTKIDHKWSMIIDHYEIDFINMNLGELEAFIKTKDKSSALAKMNSLQLLVKHIPEKEAPSLKNIL